jgi:predicted DsbA family dithiol-disulfide isomerase
MTDKKEFNIKVFVVFSLSLFIIVLTAMLIFVIRPYFIALDSDYKVKDSFEERYYFKEAADNSDPYINKVPDFADLLAGPIISDNDPIKGSADAAVAVVMFSDFACSFCKEQERLIDRALDEYQGKIMVIWKDFPESDKNSLSYRFSLAGRCAQAQGKFWEYHNRLYQAGNLNNDIIREIAVDLNLDLADFNVCLSSSEADQLIQDNIEEAYALDINGVPFIYVNDQEIFGQIDYEDLRRLIEIELESE